MNDKSTDIQVWFLRHGKSLFDYNTREYDDFMDYLRNGRKISLVENPEVDYASLPKQVDFVGYSRFTRAFETAELLRNKLDVEQMEELPLLDEVRFDEDVILRHEFKSLSENRKDFLERWCKGRNKAETFENSQARVRKIEAFLRERQEKTIILVTHGWFLRLMEVYFVQGKHKDITLEDILETKPIPFGHCIKATVKRKLPVGETPKQNALVA